MSRISASSRFTRFSRPVTGPRLTVNASAASLVAAASIHQRLEGRITEVDRRITSTENDLSAAVSDIESKRKETLRESLVYEKVGIGLFVIGVGLTGWGSVI
jgi:hypothetical protein